MSVDRVLRKEILTWRLLWQYSVYHGQVDFLVEAGRYPGRDSSGGRQTRPPEKEQPTLADMGIKQVGIVLPGYSVTRADSQHQGCLPSTEVLHQLPSCKLPDVELPGIHVPGLVDALVLAEAHRRLVDAPVFLSMPLPRIRRTMAPAGAERF